MQDEDGTVSNADVYAGLTDLFRQAFGDPLLVLRPTMTADDIEGWDSMKMVRLLVAVEKHFSIELRSREVDELASVEDLARLIVTKHR